MGAVEVGGCEESGGSTSGTMDVRCIFILSKQACMNNTTPMPSSEVCALLHTLDGGGANTSSIQEETTFTKITRIALLHNVKHMSTILYILSLLTSLSIRNTITSVLVPAKHVYKTKTAVSEAHVRTMKSKHEAGWLNHLSKSTLDRLYSVAEGADGDTPSGARAQLNIEANTTLKDRRLDDHFCFISISSYLTTYPPPVRCSSPVRTPMARSRYCRQYLLPPVLSVQTPLSTPSAISKPQHQAAR